MKNYIIIISLFGVFLFGSQDHCELQDNQQSERTNYDIGDTMSLEDQMVEHDVCYGEYPSDFFRFVDVNGAENGGDYKVTMVRMNASW